MILSYFVLLNRFKASVHKSKEIPVYVVGDLASYGIEYGS